MIKLTMDSLHLYFVKCSSSGWHKGLCLLVGDLKGVSMCVLQWGQLLLSHKLCSLFSLSSQFPIVMFKISVHYCCIIGQQTNVVVSNETNEDVRMYT